MRVLVHEGLARLHLHYLIGMAGLESTKILVESCVDVELLYAEPGGSALRRHEVGHLLLLLLILLLLLLQELSELSL